MFISYKSGAGKRHCGLSSCKSKRLLTASLVISLFTISFATTSSVAATVTHTANDGFNANGFDGNTNWSDFGAPSPGNDYVLQQWDARTAPDSNPHTFLGDSLTITD